MKVSVRPNLVIFHDPQDWETIRQLLVRDHGAATLMISWRLRRELGFTVRQHRSLVTLAEKHGIDSSLLSIYNDRHRMTREDQIHLDFYSESAQTWFVLKYLNL